MGVNVTLDEYKHFQVTFASNRNIGSQPLIQVEAATCQTNGCQPYTAGLTVTSSAGFTGSLYVTTAGYMDALTEFVTCSDRGICDRDSGRCECEPGYHGLACESQNEIH